MSMRAITRLSMVLAALATPLAAGQLNFSGWTEQRFSLFSKVEFRQAGQTLVVRGNDAASMIWRRLPEAEWGARAASWDWEVVVSVPATDLAKKGGDDRNAALYFVFLPRDVAQASAGSGNIRALLANEDARVLVYVWGGAHSRGVVLDSPYLGPRGKTVVLRPSGTGSFSETVDLAADFGRAFGGSPGALVGVAVSADSDDTNTMVAGEIRALTLR